MATLPRCSQPDHVPWRPRKEVISENGMQRSWIRSNLVEILNATFLHDLTLDPWTGNQAIFTPGHCPATLKRCGVPRVHQAGIHRESQDVLYKNTCSILLPKPPSFPVREVVLAVGKLCCHAETLMEPVLSTDEQALMGASSWYI